MAQYLSAAELSERWSGQISTKTLANWRSLGRGPQWRRYCGRVLYYLEAIVAFEEASTFGSTRSYDNRRAASHPGASSPSCAAQRDALQLVRDRKLKAIAEARLQLEEQAAIAEHEFQSALALVKPRRGRPRKTVNSNDEIV